MIKNSGLALIPMLVLLLSLSVINCSGGSSSGGTDTINDDSSGANWSGTGESLTVDDIVNDAADTSVNASLNKTVTTSASAPFYFGRFIFKDGADIFCGSIKFKMNRQSSSSAYFSDVSLENMSEVINGTTSTTIVSSSIDLDVDPSYNASTNHVEIADATNRFVGFDVDFGNNDYFTGITDAGVMFSSDFATMAGGNDDTFFFIAQKVTSQPDVSNSDIVDDWSAIRFSVDSTGTVSIESALDISIDGTNSDSLNPFNGTDSDFGNFEGFAGLTDESAGCFAYTFELDTIDGGFLLSADQTLAVGYDIDTGTYFAMEK